MKIDINKKYRTKNGMEARIYAVDGIGEWPVHGAVKGNGGWILCSWMEDGVRGSEYDLVEVMPYEDLKIDDPVIVWNNEEYKFRRYFAGVNADGKPMAWDSGSTSWSAGNSDKPLPWDYCEPADVK